jgi:hypothetical protein
MVGAGARIRKSANPSGGGSDQKGRMDDGNIVGGKLRRGRSRDLWTGEKRTRSETGLTNDARTRIIRAFLNPEEFIRIRCGRDGRRAARLSFQDLRPSFSTVHVTERAHH